MNVAPFKLIYFRVPTLLKKLSLLPILKVSPDKSRIFKFLHLLKILIVSFIIPVDTYDRLTVSSLVQSSNTLINPVNLGALKLERLTDFNEPQLSKT